MKLTEKELRDLLNETLNKSKEGEKMKKEHKENKKTENKENMKTETTEKDYKYSINEVMRDVQKTAVITITAIGTLILCTVGAE
tara:strand:+ start:393 stop:644 length:252 start_codon:yes stop_codon:yes gene_type:complete